MRRMGNRQGPGSIALLAATAAVLAFSPLAGNAFANRQPQVERSIVAGIHTTKSAAALHKMDSSTHKGEPAVKKNVTRSASGHTREEEKKVLKGLGLFFVGLLLLAAKGIWDCRHDGTPPYDEPHGPH